MSEFFYVGLAILSAVMAFYGRYLFKSSNDVVEHLDDLEQYDRVAKFIYECDPNRENTTIKKDKKRSKTERNVGVLLLVLALVIAIVTLAILII